MRYVVRNNFFGLESRGRHQEVTGAAPAATAGSEGSSSAQRGTVVPEVSKKEGLKPGEAVIVDEHLPQTRENHGAVTDQSCSEQFKDPPLEVGAGFRNTPEEAGRELHSVNLTVTDTVTSTFNVYDDEIWERPGGFV